MKLRLKNNFLRLRLNEHETTRFAAAGRVEETIKFGLNASQNLIYALETADTEKIAAEFDGHRIIVRVPRKQAEIWVGGEQISIEAEQEVGDGSRLRILIEKDLIRDERQPAKTEKIKRM